MFLLEIYLASEDRNFSWASRAAFASSSSYRLQLYHDDPCGSHDPKHTQQKSCLQFWFLHTYIYCTMTVYFYSIFSFNYSNELILWTAHVWNVAFSKTFVNIYSEHDLFTMWLHPPSFSMVTLHLGHSFVLAAIQFDVSESSSHFLIHFLRYLQSTGSCQFSPHSKQNTCPHLQTTGRDST